MVYSTSSYQWFYFVICVLKVTLISAFDHSRCLCPHFIHIFFKLGIIDLFQLVEYLVNIIASHPIFTFLKGQIWNLICVFIFIDVFRKITILFWCRRHKQKIWRNVAHFIYLTLLLIYFSIRCTIDRVFVFLSLFFHFPKINFFLYFI